MEGLTRPETETPAPQRKHRSLARTNTETRVAPGAVPTAGRPAWASITSAHQQPQRAEGELSHRRALGVAHRGDREAALGEHREVGRGLALAAAVRDQALALELAHHVAQALVRR